ncbi:uncharacterized protein LOC131651284 [Vicia villosa]|uniref:uncharacterized protein LOC131651284 n=1 Tax=Vicia villosa TaxID=3911 RepID=UPI00273B0860|nr:uncharacterized protein LOC131651284 [Vicia villosa]
MLSVNVNGVLNGYFPCSRGVRQGKVSNINLLISTFDEYADVSGQRVNCSKSHIFGGAMKSSRLNILSKISGFKIGAYPFVYLGITIFKGKPKAVYLRPIADRVKNKLASWKGSLLSFAGRVELFKSFIQSMLIHSFAIYAWPIFLIRDNKQAIKRFIWSGETTVLRLRVQRKGSFIKHHIYSSLWSSLKAKLATVVDNSSWCLGNGASINLWFDNWCGMPFHLDMSDGV